MSEMNPSSANTTDVEYGVSLATDGDAPDLPESGRGGGGGGIDESDRSGRSVPEKKLSNVSRMYDINGDGILDTVEEKMRNMDLSGRGHLKNEMVYQLMMENIDTHKKLFRTKRIMFFLIFLVVILALSNLGTSFAAASLSKDTSTNEYDQLTSKSTGGALATQATEETFELERATLDSEGRRRLCRRGEESNIECTTDSFMSLPKKQCNRMVMLCNRGNFVGLHHDWGYGKESHFVVCPSMGSFDRYGASRRRNVQGEDYYFERDEDDNCNMWGKALGQKEDEICVTDSDCMPGVGLRCIHDDLVVEGCKRSCARKRWAPHKVLECKNNCDHPVCRGQGVDVDP